MSEFPPVPEPAVKSVAEMSEEEQYKLVLIDQSRDAHDQARDLADEQLTEELNEGGWLKRAVSSVWKGNLMKDYYRQKYTRQHEAIIAESNNVLQSESATDAQTNSINALISRFQSNEDELIHADAGERRQVHTDDLLSVGLKDIIRRFAVDKTLNETTLEQEKKKLLEAYGQENPDADLSKSLVLSDNLLEVAQSIKGRFTHDEAMERAIATMEIITGEARNGARTEAQRSSVDVAIDALSKTRIGSLLTPGTLATGTALALSVAGIGTKSVVGAAAATAGLGTVAGLWAGVRENKRVKDERSQHAREMATGGSFDTGGEGEKGDKRRVEMEAVRYESLSALDLAKELLDKTSEEAFAAGEQQAEAVRVALEALARAQARVEISDTEKIDLVHYSSKADVGEERMKFDLARIEARKALASVLTSEVRETLDISEALSIKEIVAEQAEEYKHEFHDDINKKDEAFRALKRRRVAKAALVGTAVGIAGGLVAQEAMAAIDPSRFGVFEALSGAQAPVSADGEVHQTILTSLVNGEQHIEHIDASETFNQHDFSGESFIKTGDDLEWSQQSDGSYSIIGPDGTPAVDGIVVNADGSIDQPTLDKIESAGLNVEDNSWTDHVETMVDREISLDQYWQENAAEMQMTSIDTWYMNNSPNPDLNEVRLYRGGDNGLIDGGFRFESGMTPDGSFVDGQSVNPVEAARQGDLVWVVSRIGEDNDAMFTLPSGPDGSLTIMKDDPAGALFSEVNGRAELAQGYRLHAFYSEGVDANGTLHGGSLATMVGEAEVSTTVQSETVVNEVAHHEYVISSNGYDVAHDNITEVAPITPIVGRKSLETLSSEDKGIQEGVRGASYYNREPTEAEREKIVHEFSPRLQQNGEATLNPEEELGWFEDELRRKKGAEYVQKLETFADNDPTLRTLSNQTESIVTIPVAAAYESENIYGTLSLYAQQEAEGADKSTILLNVNWLDTAMDDPVKVAAMQKTLAEIERARRDFPRLSIAVMQNEYNEAAVDATGGVIGYAVDDLVNAALIANRRSIVAGRMSPEHDTLIVRGDADTRGVSRTHLKNLHKAASQEKNLDVIKGTTRFGSAEAKNFPVYGVISSFMTLFQTVSASENHIHTGGANFAVRGSTFAAIGGLGDVREWSGPGSDDVAIGQRIAIARRIRSDRPLGYSQGVSYGTVADSSQKSDAVKRVKTITGATVDTDGGRLLRAHLAGGLSQEVWNPDEQNGFTDGDGGYRSRTEDESISNNAQKERFTNEAAFSAIERALEFELNQSTPAAGRKVLSLIFGSVGGAYKITGDHNTGELKFRLTEAGKNYIKDRVERESNGKYGPFGMRKMRQLYGVVGSKAKRQPASNKSPLVSPLR